MKRINGNEIVIRDGFIYHQDTNEPVTGIVECFRENSKLHFRGNFINGKEEGLFERFHENGQLEERGTFIDDEPDGLWEDFDEDGNLFKTQTYRNGELVEENNNP